MDRNNLDGYIYSTSDDVYVPVDERPHKLRSIYVSARNNIDCLNIIKFFHQAWHHAPCTTQPSRHLNSGKLNLLALHIAHSGRASRTDGSNDTLDIIIIMSNLSLNATAGMI